MSPAQWTSSIVAIAALAVSAANFVIADRRARRTERELRYREEQQELLEANSLLDTAFDLLYGRDGYSSTKDRESVNSAEVLINRACEIAPNNARAVLYKARVHSARGSTTLAIQYCRKSIDLDPTSGSAHNDLGLILGVDGGEEYFRIAIEREPDSAAYHTNLGNLLERVRRNDDAKQAYEKALALEPRHSRAHTKLANLVRTSDPDRAQSHFQQAIDADSACTDAMVGLGRLLMDEGEDEEGIAWIEHAATINPKDEYPVAMAAAIFADRQQPEQALKYGLRAITTTPSRRFAGDSVSDLIAAMKELAERSTQGDAALGEE